MKCIMVLLFVTNFLYSYYPWPISGVNDQHNVTGGYGEVRSKEVDNEWVYRHHVHDGIDIDIIMNNVPVYPVVSGVISNNPQGSETLIVRDEFFNYYSYHHLVNIPDTLENDTYVEAGETILGSINTGNSNHLHFVDGTLNEDTYNPLLSVEPFNDYDNPVIDYIKLVQNDSTSALPTNGEGLPIVNTNQKIDVLVKAHEVVSSPGGDNNSVYYINTNIYDPDDTLIDTFFDMLFPSGGNNGTWDVEKIYADGSKAGSGISGVYIYVSTNYLNSDYYWENTGMTEGEYTIEVLIQDESLNSENMSTTMYVQGSAMTESKIMARILNKNQ